MHFQNNLIAEIILAIKLLCILEKLRLHLRGNLSSEIAVEAIPTYDNGAWHHCVMTYNGNSDATGVKIYVDGSEQSTTTIANTLTVDITSSANFQLSGRNAFGVS